MPQLVIENTPLYAIHSWMADGGATLKSREPSPTILPYGTETFTQRMLSCTTHDLDVGRLRHGYQISHHSNRVVLPGLSDPTKAL